jgi:TolB protein
MRWGIATLVFLLAAALSAACGPATDVGPGGPTLTAMDDTVLPSDTPLPASATPKLVTGAAACRGRITFIRRDGGAAGIYALQADGSGLTAVVGDPGNVYSLSLSPDGTYIAYVAQKDDRYGVFVAGGGQARRLALDGSHADPAWSPDGERFLLVTTIQGLRTELYAIDPGGGEAEQLTETALQKTGPAWSPDGERIAFTMLDAYNQGEVWVMPAPPGTGEPVNLTGHPAHDCCAVWSPDGHRLAFLSSRADEGVRSAGSLLPAAYGAGAPRPLTTVVPEAPRDIYLVNRDGSGLRNLTQDEGHERDLAWSPDGRWLAYVSDRDGGQEIYLIEVDGGQRVRLTDDDWRDLSPVWSPDGGCLAFVSSRDGGYGIYLLAVAPEQGAVPDEAWKLVDGGTSQGGLGWTP